MKQLVRVRLSDSYVLATVDGVEDVDETYSFAGQVGAVPRTVRVGRGGGGHRIVHGPACTDRDSPTYGFPYTFVISLSPHPATVPACS